MKGFTYQTGQRFRVAKLVFKNVLFLFFKFLLQLLQKKSLSLDINKCSH